MTTPIETKRGLGSRLAGLVGFLLWRSPVLLLMVAVPCVAVWIMIKPVPGAALKTLDSPAVAVTAAKGEDSKETLGIDFTKLSFVPAKDPVDAKTGQPRYADQLPETIKGYDGRKVRIRGFLMPVKMDGNEVREFLIMANQMSCCFGTTPRFWEFVAAKATGDAVPNLMDRPLTFEGTLRVGDVYENGYWTQLYRMECTAVGK